MDEPIHLSRTLITGIIDRDTPKVVLQEIAEVHGIPIPKTLDSDETRDKFVNSLVRSGRDQPIISSQISTDISKIARFVNRRVEWPLDSLVEAFGILKIYMKEAPLPGANFPYGTQIPSNPERLNACVLYKLCKAQGLPLKYYHTIDQMAAAIKMLLQRESETRTFFRMQSGRIDVDVLPSLYLISCPHMKEFPLINEDSDEEGASEVVMVDCYEDIELSVATFDDHKQTLLRVIPRTIGEAIVLAAKNFKIDLTSCKAPIYEYINLRKNQSSWVPIDPEMKKSRQLNPLAFCMDVYFNPRIPYQLYDSEGLMRLAINEGYLSSDLRNEGAYSLLETSRLSPTFYHGIYPTISNKRTPIGWKSIRKLSPDCIICFGVLEEDLKAFTYDELSENIMHTKNFINPLDEEGHPFPQIALRKLKILSNVIRADESPEATQGRKNLSRAIELGELFTDAINVKIKDFYVFYEETSPENKVKIHKILNSFFRLAMFTRGWDPESDEIYPIEEALVANQHEVDVRVTQGISDFENICENSELLGPIFLDLPLVRYRGGWQISTSARDGTNIRERLAILKNGDEHSDQNSCMRLTSNWFAASAHRYMVIVGLDPPFDIEKLRAIS